MSPFLPLLKIFCLHFPFVTAQGSVALFLDAGCQHSSAINPSYNVHLDICLVTSGAAGIITETLPTCDSGVATLVLYRDTSCAASMPGNNSSGCLSNSPVYDIPAVMFICPAVAGYPTVRDTLTVSATFSSSNTGGAFYATAIDSSSTAVAVTAAMTDSTLSPTYPSIQNPRLSESTASAPVSSASPSRFPPSTSDGGGKTSSGLSQSDSIALGVGLSVPIAAIIVAVLIWQCPKKTGDRDQGAMGGAGRYSD